MERLSMHADAVGLTVERDGPFASLGLLSHDGEQMLSFVRDAAWLASISGHSRVAAVITTAELAGQMPAHIAVAVTADPAAAFYRLHEHLRDQTHFYGAPVETRIAASAGVDSRAVIPATDISIGERVVIEPYVVLQGRVVIEDDAVIRAGCVIGADGFQVLMPGAHRVAHAGSVRIGRGAEIRANTCIDRALFGGATTIGEASTLDHFVYVAHDVRMGARCRVGAAAVLNGSLRIGTDVWIGPGASIRDGLAIGDGAMVSIGSVVTLDVAAGARVTGNFAIPHEQFLESLRR
jgi:UDP-3-O-[3-hydroxymyristoyl] glucosamine N-acyltransferase